MPVHASEMYSRNLFNFISPFIKNGELQIDWTDEIVAGSLFSAKPGTTRRSEESTREIEKYQFANLVNFLFIV